MMHGYTCNGQHVCLKPLHNMMDAPATLLVTRGGQSHRWRMRSGPPPLSLQHHSTAHVGLMGYVGVGRATRTRHSVESCIACRLKWPRSAKSASAPATK